MYEPWLGHFALLITSLFVDRNIETSSHTHALDMQFPLTRMGTDNNKYFGLMSHPVACRTLNNISIEQLNNAAM